MCSNRRKISKPLFPTWTNQWRMVIIHKSNTCGRPSLIWGWKFKIIWLKYSATWAWHQQLWISLLIFTYFITFNTLTLQKNYSSNSNYCPGHGGFIFIVPLNASIDITLHPGHQHMKNLRSIQCAEVKTSGLNSSTIKVAQKLQRNTMQD
jgi:hypothetical protein